MKTTMQIIYGILAIIMLIVSVAVVIVICMKDAGFTNADCYIFDNSYTRCSLCLFMYMIFAAFLGYKYIVHDDDNQEED